MDEGIKKILLESMRLKRRTLITGVVASGLLDLILILVLILQFNTLSFGVVILLLVLALPTPFYFFYRLLPSRNLEQTPFMKLIKENPKKIVWVHDYATDAVAQATWIPNLVSIMVRTDDGKRIALPVREKNKEILLNFIQKISPQVVFGNSKENRKAYQKNPKNMNQNLK